MEFKEYIKPELLVLVPVLYLIGAALKQSAFKNKHIPWILGVVSVLLCVVWVIGHTSITTSAEVASAVFVAVTQGVLLAGSSVYADQLIKQAKKER